MNIGAIVICGGKGRRMGGPKASMPFGPETLLERVVRLVEPAVGPIVVVAASGQSIPEFSGNVRVVTDAVADRGPLQALETGFEAIDDVVELVYATAIDAPFLALGWIDRLVGLIGDADLAIPAIAGQIYPLAALYRRRAVIPAIRSLLGRDVLRLKSLTALLKTREIGADDLRVVDPDLLTLVNMNTPDDYRNALDRAGFTPELRG